MSDDGQKTLKSSLEPEGSVSEGNAGAAMAAPTPLERYELEPINDFIVVEEMKRDKNPVKVGLLYMPQTNKSDHHTHARVIGVGHGKMTIGGFRVPPSVNVGDVVIFEKSMAREFKYLNIDCLILDEACIQGKLVKK